VTTILPHHQSWLNAHPHRSAEWLAARIGDGFDIHHLDRDHESNDPTNLVLIEHSDHLMLHSGSGSRTLGRLSARRPAKPRKPKRLRDLLAAFDRVEERDAERRCIDERR
jgi:hypothetical protein